jgi:hypothetical protein
VNTSVGCMTFSLFPGLICADEFVIARFAKFKTRKLVIPADYNIHAQLCVSEEDRSQLLVFFTTLQDTTRTPVYRRWKT